MDDSGSGGIWIGGEGFVVALATLGNTVIFNSLLPVSRSDSPKLNVQEGNPSKMILQGRIGDLLRVTTATI